MKNLNKCPCCKTNWLCLPNKIYYGATVLCVDCMGIMNVVTKKYYGEYVVNYRKIRYNEWKFLRNAIIVKNYLEEISKNKIDKNTKSKMILSAIIFFIAFIISCFMM